jgi:glucan phosphoethanolaminetransferase (alkaline phosphatase superfamily)
LCYFVFNSFCWKKYLKDIVKVGGKMKRVSINIAVFLLIAWVAALLLNIDIYRKANIEISIFGPIIDAILLMVIGLIIYLLVAFYSRRGDSPKKWINRSLFLLGICTIFMISFFYIVTFR